MDEQEKFRANIESRMTKFNESLEEIIANAEQKRSTHSDIPMVSLVRKRDDLAARLKEAEDADESSRPELLTELERLFENIDNDTREALAYYF